LAYKPHEYYSYIHHVIYFYAFVYGGPILCKANERQQEGINAVDQLLKVEASNLVSAATNSWGIPAVCEMENGENGP